MASLQPASSVAKRKFRRAVRVLSSVRTMRSASSASVATRRAALQNFPGDSDVASSSDKPKRRSRSVINKIVRRLLLKSRKNRVEDTTTSSSGNETAAKIRRRDLFQKVRTAIRVARNLRPTNTSDDKDDEKETSEESPDESSSARRRESRAQQLINARLAAEAEKALIANPPKHLAILMAAKSADWRTFEREINACRKGHPFINAAHPQTGETALMFACQHARLLAIGRLLELGAMVNMRANDQRTALHYAAQNGDEDNITFLLQNGADPNLFGGVDNQLPLHMLLSRRATINLSTAQLLLRASLKQSRLLKDGRGNLPITYAVERESLALVKEMLHYFPKQQVTWRHEQTGDYLVHMATRRKNMQMISLLVKEGGARINVQNTIGQTPLHFCAQEGDFTMIKMLRQFRARADVADKKEMTPLHIAAQNGYTAIVQLFIKLYKANIQLRTKDGSTLTHLAAERGHVHTVLVLMKRGISMHTTNKLGALSLHMAAQGGHAKVVKALIKKGLSVDSRTNEGYTALHLAVLNNRVDTIFTLLGLGAKVDLKGGSLKEAALHIAARQPEGFSCAESLLKSGAFVNNTTDETLETPLHIAAKTGTTDLVKLLLEEGADPMLLTKSGESALHYAVRYCWFDCAKAIVNFVNNMSNAKNREAINLVNLANYEGETCFHLAAELAKSQAHNPFDDVDIVRLLLENGADPRSMTVLTNETSLHYCTRSGNPDILQEIVRYFKPGHFQVACSRQDKIGWSAVMTACQLGHAAVLEIALSNGARADIFDEFGKAGLHIAAENGHIDCCDVMLKNKAFINAKSKTGIAPLHLTAQNGYVDLTEMLIKKYHATVNILSLDQQTPLHLAAQAGQKEACSLLLKLEADITALDSLGQTPLHLAAEKDHADVVKLFVKNKPELITAFSKAGNTCAHIAARNGSEAVIKLLMRYNKKLVTDIRNRINESLPIHLAVTGSHESVVQLLVEAGASPIAENHEGMTPIHMAAKEGDMEVLEAIIASSPSEKLKANSLKNGLSAMHVAAFYGKTEIIRVLVEHDVDVNCKSNPPQLTGVVSDPDLKAVITNDHGLTPLHMAAVRGHELVARFILNNSNVNTELVSDVLNRLPVHYACLHGNVIVVSILMSRSPQHLTLQDKLGRFPLHLAAENGHANMVSMILRQGVEINCVDNEQWTPLHYAARNGHIKVVKLLCENGASPIMQTDEGKIPLVLSARGGYVDVMLYLLSKEHDTLQFIDDKTFLMDLSLVSKKSNNEVIDEFALQSKAPLYVAARLSQLYHNLAEQEKEHVKDLFSLSRHCEHMATDLLGIASSLTPSPAVILQETDEQGKQLLDIFLECNLKDVVKHPTVQRFLSDKWSGPLAKWTSNRLILLFLGFLLFPPLLVYFCWPSKANRYHHAPVIKFLAMLVSHIYLIALLYLVAGVPFHPLVYRKDFYPLWYEYLLLAFMSGMLVAELLKQNGATGLGMLRYVMIFCTAAGTLFQIVAIVFDDGYEGRDSIAMNLMYTRNFMLSVVILLAVLLIFDFLLIHPLFGPFGIIISRVLSDMMTFLVVLFIFLVAFTFLICCLFSPIKRDDDVIVTNNPTNITSNLTVIDNLTTTATQPTLLKVKKETKTLCKICPKSNANKKRCQLRNVGTSSTSSSSSDANSYTRAGRLIANGGDRNPLLSNSDPSTLIAQFEMLFFAMLGMFDFGAVPLVKNGPDWSSILIEIYLAIWLTAAALILLQILVAILTDSYKVVQMRSDTEWKFGRAVLIRDMIKMPAAPTPLNLVFRPFLYLRSLIKHRGKMCTPYASYYAVADEQEGSDDFYRQLDNTGGGGVTSAADAPIDWKMVVRRYRALIKGDTAELRKLAEEDAAAFSLDESNEAADASTPIFN